MVIYFRFCKLSRHL